MIEEIAIATPVSPMFSTLTVFDPPSLLASWLVGNVPIRPSFFLKHVGLKSAVQSWIDWRALRVSAPLRQNLESLFDQWSL